MNLNYLQSTLDEYKVLCKEERDYLHIAQQLDRWGEVEEARSIRMEIQIIRIKKQQLESVGMKDEKKFGSAKSTVFKFNVFTAHGQNQYLCRKISYPKGKTRVFHIRRNEKDRSCGRANGLNNLM